MPKINGKSISIPIVFIVLLFVGAMTTMGGWALADSKEQNQRLGNVEMSCALIIQAADGLAHEVRTSNQNSGELKELISELIEIEESKKRPKPTKRKSVGEDDGR